LPGFRQGRQSEKSGNMLAVCRRSCCPLRPFRTDTWTLTA
jgi:hypothetical protein